MKTPKQYRNLSILVLTLLIAVTGGVAQDFKSALFVNANAALKEARAANADILAPKAFSEGMEVYKKARSDFEKGRNLTEIRKNLAMATKRFRKAVEASKIASAAMGTTIQARMDALGSEAPGFSPKLWQDAEKKFAEATSTLETGSIKEAQKKAKEAEKLYRDAELKAIKANYLNETYQILKEAERLTIKEYAPKTVQSARALVKEAEKELNENRYDTDKARILARQAKREAKHAMYLGLTIKDMREKKQSWEDVMLMGERPVTRIASVIDLVPSFEDGPKKPTDEIIKNIKDYQKNNASLSSELFDAQQRNLLLTDRTAELEEMLSGVEREKSELAQKIEAQAKIEALYDEVEKLFTGEFAIFIRQGHDVIIRTVGVGFPVGKATVDPKYHDFLARVGKAIRMFQNATVTVEGHTDSYGSDETNFKLSMQRAEAVKYHLTHTLGFEPAIIESIGYGESRPIATNETEEGRARNRRIEFVIHPRISWGS